MSELEEKMRRDADAIERMFASAAFAFRAIYHPPAPPPPTPEEIASTETRRVSCTCAGCVACCSHTPGIFKPGEAEKVAEFLGLTLPELHAQYLYTLEHDGDWIDESGDFEHWKVLVPAVHGPYAPGKTISYAQRGRCVFLENDRCRIHAVKPYECAQSVCRSPSDASSRDARDIASKEWNTPEHQSLFDSLRGET